MTWTVTKKKETMTSTDDVKGDKRKGNDDVKCDNVIACGGDAMNGDEW